DRVRSETQRMGFLIDDMLKLSRVTSTEIRLAPVDLSAMVQGISNRLKEQNAGRQIEFVIEPSLKVPGDVRLLEIAFTNLLANAVKFTAPRELARIEFGRIAADTGRDDEPANRGAGRDSEAVYYIRDNGVGFDMAYASGLFRAFQRLHKVS